jgi:transcriptional regulator with XRE-family HTH domain
MSPMSDELATAVGERIRRLRLDAGLGLRELARELGISPSALSGLENHRGGMSIARLQLVAAHFDLRLTELLAGDEDDEADHDGLEVEIFRSPATKAPAIERGDGVIYQLLGKPGSHRLQSTLITFSPGGSYERDRIGHPGEEFAFVVLGQVELLIGDEVHALGTSDAARFKTERAHAYRNASEVGMAFLLATVTPPW